jgi:hypothetical protein
LAGSDKNIGIPEASIASAIPRLEGLNQELIAKSEPKALVTAATAQK